MQASQEVDVRDILDCDYKLIAQISGTAVLPDEKCLSSMTEVDIPLVSRVFGPYCKLRTEFFFHRIMAQARGARAINRWTKTRIRNLQYGPKKRG